MRTVGICALVGFAVVGLVSVVLAMIDGLEFKKWWVYLLVGILALAVIIIAGGLVSIIALFIVQVFKVGFPQLMSL